MKLPCDFAPDCKNIHNKFTEIRIPIAKTQRLFDGMYLKSLSKPHYPPPSEQLNMFHMPAFLFLTTHHPQHFGSRNFFNLSIIHISKMFLMITGLIIKKFEALTTTKHQLILINSYTTTLHLPADFRLFFRNYRHSTLADASIPSLSPKINFLLLTSLSCKP